MSKKLKIYGLLKKKGRKGNKLFDRSGLTRGMQFTEVKAVPYSEIKGALGKSAKRKLN